MPLHVTPYTPELRAAWDAFVEAHPQGSPLHLIAWKHSLEATFGYRSLYLTVESGAALRGVLPLFLVENFLQGRVLISTPFAVYGGILAADDEARQALAEAAHRLGHDLRVQHVELRNGWPAQCAGWPTLDRYATFTQTQLPADDEELLAALPKKTRNMIRKALKSPFESRITRDTGPFYELLSGTYRRLGTPVFARRHFDTLLREFGPLADIREVRLEGTLAAVSFNFLFRGEMHTYYAASHQDYLNLAVNNFLYYDHLLWAGRNGFQSFDFGRSKYDTGNLEFKKHWLAEMRPLPYEILLVGRKEMPNFTPKNEKFGLAIRVWQRLPLPVTRLLGPPVVKLFP